MSDPYAALAMMHLLGEMEVVTEVVTTVVSVVVTNAVEVDVLVVVVVVEVPVDDVTNTYTVVGVETVMK
jgi:hypothetical protein